MVVVVVVDVNMNVNGDDGGERGWGNRISQHNTPAANNYKRVCCIGNGEGCKFLKTFSLLRLHSLSTFSIDHIGERSEQFANQLTGYQDIVICVPFEAERNKVHNVNIDRNEETCGPLEPVKTKSSDE